MIFDKFGNYVVFLFVFFVDLVVILGCWMVVFIVCDYFMLVVVFICFCSDDMLYGCYWGMYGNYYSLYFELCFY